MEPLKLTMVYILLVLVLWFLSFPGVRFAWTWILTFLVLTFTLLAIRFFKIPKRVLPIGLTVLIGMMLIRGVLREVSSEEWPPLFFPEETIVVENYIVEPFGNGTLRVVPGVECWGLTPPCKPEYNFFEIEWRGEKLTDGFREKK